MVNEKRIRQRNNRPAEGGPVVYWMQRDQRVHDNWALLYACEVAKERKTNFFVVFNLVSKFSDTTWRHYDFMFRGLQEVEAELGRLNIPFVLTKGDPKDMIPELVKEYGVGEVVTDFNPLRFTDKWRTEVASKINVRLSEVDAHNIIPCWVASDKEEFAAYTFRPKVHKQLRVWLVDYPRLSKQTIDSTVLSSKIDWHELLKNLSVNRKVEPVEWLIPGSQAGLDMLDEFIRKRLPTYHQDRNDPTRDGQSNLSPYLHFGQLSPQRVALEVSKTKAPKDAKDALLEELIVRREITDNYCFYNNKYDKVEGAHEWAQKSIKEHKNDKREYVYRKAEFEEAKTHDELWNAMQKQMMETGKMHGWCRMYWAKKILEWTPDVQTAIDTALYLNDKYELDGSDPNGVVGVMWSICGVHDRAWTERPVFGKIRYMNFAGAKRKFPVDEYIQKFNSSRNKLF